MQRLFLSSFRQNFAGIFRKNNWVWHLVAIGLTYLLVQSGFDWWYYEATRIPSLLSVAILAGALGFLVPIFLPLGLYIWGKEHKNTRMQILAVMAVQAEAIALILSSAYKSLTGRLQPELVVHSYPQIDISSAFNFGFLQHGIFWGWPSSHTTVAFAMAATLAIVYKKNRMIFATLLLYAFYIGLGVSVTIHWFSDFAAGAILGTLIGVVVARSAIIQMQE